jgi:hypothetical protein
MAESKYLLKPELVIEIGRNMFTVQSLSNANLRHLVRKIADCNCPLKVGVYSTDMQLAELQLLSVPMSNVWRMLGTIHVHL